jgi:cytochrome c oxidase assembly protein subunit 11
MTSSKDKKKSKTSRKGLLILFLIVIGMFGFSFALVPLYNAFCKVTGLNGKAGGQTFAVRSERYDGEIDTARTITVQFLVTNNANLPWEIKPTMTSIELHPGEKKYVAYLARNTSDHTMVVQAIPSIAPGQAAAHLKKTQCFCFEHQSLQAGESKEMPIVFHLDKEIPGWINTVSLSYTFFDVTDQADHTNQQPVGRIQP